MQQCLGSWTACNAGLRDPPQAAAQVPGTLTQGNRALDCPMHPHAIHPRPRLDFQD